MSIPNQLKIFEGGHDWAPETICTEAIEWLEVLAIKTNRRSVDEALVQALFSKQLAAAQASEAGRNTYDSYLCYRALINAFKGLKDVAAAEQKAGELESSKEVKAALASQQEQERQQRALQQ